jgi:hypothetical protein
VAIYGYNTAERVKVKDGEGAIVAQELRQGRMLHDRRAWAAV